MYQAETDGFLDEKAQACFEKNQGYKTKDTCENKKKYKMKICTHLAGMGHFNGNPDICFHDRGFIPPTVKNDGIWRYRLDLELQSLVNEDLSDIPD